LEVGPVLGINCGTKVVKPDCKTVINESPVEEEALVKERNNVCHLIDCNVEVGNSRGG
jgi:hypothetical protein